MYDSLSEDVRFAVLDLPWGLHFLVNLPTCSACATIVSFWLVSSACRSPLI
ncbi:MAG: hypothetical protein J07HN6_01049, partial [Halonotius sp. J07HN6]